MAREGDVLAGKYRVERVLGIGGMGMVVEAMHLELEQRVALKFMLPEAMQSQHAVERFLREAKASVMLRSEHICRVLDVGKLESGAPYIVMEYMDGHDFAELIRRRGRLPVAEAVDYGLQALEGIAEAHAKKIVHRDLKPANLFVTIESDGSPLVKVLDFGISKNTAVGSATKTGDILGSPAYMAPEQMMSSKNVDGRADIWAFGVILYEAVTGQLPFAGDTLPVLCMAVIHDDPVPPMQHRPDLDPAFGAVIMRCLDKRLEHRFPDVASLAAALAPFGGPSSVLAAERIARMRARELGASSGRAETSPPVAVYAPTMESGPVRSVVPVTQDPLERRVPAVGAVSTLQSSAGTVEGMRAAAPRRTWMVVAGAVGALAAGVVTFAAISSRSGTSPPTSAAAPVPMAAPTPAAASPPSPPPAEPAPTPSPPPAVTITPPPAATVTPPAVSPASAAPAAGSGSPASSTLKRKRPPAVKPPTQPAPTQPKKNCDPPYVLDASGKRIYKPECLE